MVLCKNCGQMVQEGKFCENCGSKLDSIRVYPNCGAVATGNFCEECGTKIVDENFQPSANNASTSDNATSANINLQDNAEKVKNFFGNIGGSISKSMGNLATNLAAVKSNFEDTDIIYKVSKIPNLKEVKVLVEQDETMYTKIGDDISSFHETQVFAGNSYSCYYIKNLVDFNIYFKISLKPYINNLSENDTIEIIVSYDVNVKSNDKNKFFESLIKIDDLTWNIDSISSLFERNLNKTISSKMMEIIKNEKGINLLEYEKQIEKANSNIEDILKDELDKFALEIKTFKLSKVDMDLDKINDILIENLYSE